MEFYAEIQILTCLSAQVAPIGVYTSGKGSSAAGLTASVVRDPGSVRRSHRPPSQDAPMRGN